VCHDHEVEGHRVVQLLAATTNADHPANAWNVNFNNAA